MIISITFTSLGYSLLYHKWTLRHLFSLFKRTKLFWSERDFKHKTFNSVNCFKRLKQFLQILLGNPTPSQNVKADKFLRILNRLILSALAPNKSIEWFAKSELQHQQTYALSDLFLFAAFKEAFGHFVIDSQVK